MIDGKLVVFQGPESGYNKGPVIATSYTGREDRPGALQRLDLGLDRRQERHFLPLRPAIQPDGDAEFVVILAAESEAFLPAQFDDPSQFD